MNLKTRKVLWFIVWLLILSSGPLTVLLNTNFDRLGKNPISTINFLQRITGLLAFTLISIQIVLGHWMGKWTQIVGSKAYVLHIFQGIFTYLLVLVHPLLFLLITYQLSKNLPETLLAIIPRLNNQTEIYLTYGKFALILITLSVIAGYFRTKPFFRRNWLKLHVLNYFLFYAIFFHMRVGSDITSPPFVWISWLVLLLVTISALKRFIFPLFPKLGKVANEVNSQKA